MREFDSKNFNAEAFGKYMAAIPDVKLNKLLESGAIVGNAELKALFSNQTGSFYGVIPYYGNLDQNEPDNYDGSTDITADSTTTYSQGVFAYGRAKAWTEKDFSYDITSGVDFMANIRAKLIKYWAGVDQDTLLAILKGIYAMTGAKNLEFVNAHTHDISGLEGEASMVGVTTLNTATQKACGDNKHAFRLAIMHSVVATNLENQKLLQYLKYTDAQGVERDLGLATWNGRLVIIDDSMPVVDGNYTTYVLGLGAIHREPLPVKVAYEMARDPKTNGGQDTLYSRKRNAIAVPCLSWLNKSVAGLSPTKAEIENGANWGLITDAKGAKVVDHKACAIARIISKG